MVILLMLDDCTGADQELQIALEYLRPAWGGVCPPSSEVTSAEHVLDVADVDSQGKKHACHTAS